MLYSETFHEEILYNAQQNMPALSSYFELMDRVMPTSSARSAPRRSAARGSC